MKVNKLLYTAMVIIFILGIAGVLMLYAKGYSLQPSRENVVSKSGWILVKSSPDGARVFLDDAPVDPTNTSLDNLMPGVYEVVIKKEGYHDWKKNVQVKEEFVTTIDALLIKKASEIRPLTTSGITTPVSDRFDNFIIYYAQKETKEGLWVMSLTDNQFFGLSRGTPKLIAEGKIFAGFESAIWSPDSLEVLVSIANLENPLLPTTNYLLKTNILNVGFPPILTPNTITKAWEEELTQERKLLVEGLKLSPEMETIALDPTTIFSHKSDKFLYFIENGEVLEARVYDLTTLLPIGQERDTLVLKLNPTALPILKWHTTDDHIIVLEGNNISVLETDGTNSNSVFSGNLLNSFILPSPDKQNLIFYTTFSADLQPNLFSLSIN